MDSYIFIDGAALWVLIACVVAVLIGIICLGCTHINTLKENYRLKVENERLDRALSSAKYARYKATFKVPEVEDGKLC